MILTKMVFLRQPSTVNHQLSFTSTSAPFQTANSCSEESGDANLKTEKVIPIQRGCFKLLRELRVLRGLKGFSSKVAGKPQT